MLKKRNLFILLLIALLALFSRLTSTTRWVTRYPSAEFQIRLVNAANQPIPKVSFKIFQRDNKTPAYRFPLDSYREDREVLSDEEGRIVVRRTFEDTEHVHRTWKLFWCIPIGSGESVFFIHLDHPDYQSLVFQFKKLYHPVENGEQKRSYHTVKVNGREYRLPILKHAWYMKPK